MMVGEGGNLIGLYNRDPPVKYLLIVVIIYCVYKGFRINDVIHAA